jgi:putative transposase
MPGTYSQLYIQVVFAVKARQQLLQKPWREEVFKYMAGIIQNKGQRSIIVNGVSDHVHLFFGLRPAMSLSELVRDVKNNSTNFINERKFTSVKFAWQEGFGSFSYHHSQVDRIYKYIANQEAHHGNIGFREEYLEFLKEFEVDYDEKYVFEEKI